MFVFSHLSCAMADPPQQRITFTEKQLDGVPKDVISGYTKRTEGSEEVYDATYKTPDIFPIVR